MPLSDMVKKTRAGETSGFIIGDNCAAPDLPKKSYTPFCPVSAICLCAFASRAFAL